VPSAALYPDLVPPRGWNPYRQGFQIRLVPPGGEPEVAEATIVVSPIVPRHPQLPAPEKLVETAIFTEARQRFEVLEQKGPLKAKSDHGLEGVLYEVYGYPRPKQPRERRLYVLLADKVCYYSLSYLGSETGYAKHVDVFWAVVASVRPFQGTVRHPDYSASPLALMFRE
jgi:hypothetical protein